MIKLRMYSRSLIINILDAKFLETFPEYCPQGQYNNTFIKYLYRYIRMNTYCGEHDELLRTLVNLQLTDSEFADTNIKEDTNRQTYTLTDDKIGFNDSKLTKIANIVKKYYNYSYHLISPNRIIFNISFGWLPVNTASWLNLLNDECMIDYYIDGITLRKNKHSILGAGPDSGFVCYRITSVREYDTIMFLADRASMIVEDGEELGKYTVATLMNELEGSKGATLNRIVEFDLDNFFYELGPYARNYLSTEQSTLIIQVPYKYAVGEYYRVFDVSNAIQIQSKNNVDENHQDNYFVAFNDPDFEGKFIKYNMKDRFKVADRIFSMGDSFITTLIQYVLGDFIWRTTDSKIIGYAQNLLNTLYGNALLNPNGVWSSDMSELVTRYKTNFTDTLFDDDVINKETEEAMLTDYRIRYPDLDANEELFNRW